MLGAKGHNRDDVSTFGGRRFRSEPAGYKSNAERPPARVETVAKKSIVISRLPTTPNNTTMDNNDEDLILTSPRGLDPLKFSISLFICLILFVLYLLLPKGVRKQYFRAYPKRHTWSARSRPTSLLNTNNNNNNNNNHGQPDTPSTQHSQSQSQQQSHYAGAAAGSGGLLSGIPLHHPPQQQHGGNSNNNNHHHPEVIVSAAMQQLRTPGVLIVAHGSRGKPKTVRLQLTDTAITWRTESRKKKFGKLHAVPLQAVMYVDVGKQTTALRRVENAAVQEALCFSLLTKEGSLDLEASSVQERDALVSCFSLVLDEVHAQNWRDIYRGPSSDMPSSFDELDQQQQQLQLAAAQQQQQQAAAAASKAGGGGGGPPPQSSGV
jgi:hypothetical protein